MEGGDWSNAILIPHTDLSLHPGYNNKAMQQLNVKGMQYTTANGREKKSVNKDKVTNHK